jgi:hypothetical protein
VTLVFKTGSCGSQNEGKVFTFVVNKNSIYNGLIMLDANDRVHTLWGDRDYIMINPEIKKAMLRDFFDSFKIPEGTARVCCLVLFFRSSLANSSWKQLRFHQSKGNPEFDLQLHFGPLVSMDVT